ncbi:MAG: cation transporting ATPase C-terminal domain-containing protein [Candidatus Rokuibacteriota bacterium]
MFDFDAYSPQQVAQRIEAVGVAKARLPLLAMFMREPLFSRQILVVSLLLGVSVLTVVCLAYGWAVERGLPSREVRAFGFAAIVFGNLALIHATRSRDHVVLGALRSANTILW